MSSYQLHERIFEAVRDLKQNANRGLTYPILLVRPKSLISTSLRDSFLSILLLVQRPSSRPPEESDCQNVFAFDL